jgi:hypothetical protein
MGAGRQSSVALTVHANAVHGAMKPAWGNPRGLKIRSIGMKGENLFVAEFGFKQDMLP